ncbi:MAG TPA: 2-amino-4-hydroxy-6-hydroxymethyldihydropteridine diphosphokinase [Actinocrinis sp.]|jgi:2-amino-4-hydroxy-6-hydroxymethyldihydropteridine diphosphokinase
MSVAPKVVRGHVYAHSAVLALGGNLGRRLDNLQAALDALVDTPGLVVTGISAVYETEPFGGPPGEPGSLDLSGQPNYLNAVVGVVTDLPAQVLLVRTQAIEQAMHRVREERWAPRTIDVDIIVYDDLVSADAALTVPHPHAHERLFVLLPWRDVDPAAEIPGRGPIAVLLDSFDGAQGVMRRDDLALQL